MYHDLLVNSLNPLMDEIVSGRQSMRALPTLGELEASVLRFYYSHSAKRDGQQLTYQDESLAVNQSPLDLSYPLSLSNYYPPATKCPD